jgi:hypothetical protein
MALLACLRSYRQIGGAAQESVGEATKTQKVIQRTEKLRTLQYDRRILNIGPVGRDQRLGAVRENEKELQAVGHAGLSQDLQRLPFERVMRAGDGHPFGKVLMMGSVSCAPLTTSAMNG